MEQLIYIEQDDKNKAAKLAEGFILEETKTRAYINALGCELGMKYLAQENISVSNIYNLHNMHKIREEFDIADIMLPNIHIDVRVVYDENLIFIPQSHFEYELTPDIYLVFKMAENLTYVEFLGFFEPKLINKNNKNDKYFFIEKEKLSHPSDLKSFIENFNGNTTEALSEDESADCRRLAISLIDHDINNSDKKNLIKMLTKSAALREELTEFDNFEFISYHTVTSEDFEDFYDNANNIFTKSISTDEFDSFEEDDEFTDFENEDIENDFADELSEEVPQESDSSDNTEEEITDETEEEILTQQDELTDFEDNLAYDIDETEPIPDTENLTEETETSQITDTLLLDNIQKELPDEELDEVFLDLPDAEENTVSFDSMNLDEPFETAEPEPLKETGTIALENIEAPADDIETEEPEEYTAQSFENLENIEDNKSLIEKPDESSLALNELPDDTPPETIAFDNLEIIEEYTEEPNEQELAETIAFDEFETEHPETTEEEEIPETLSLEALSEPDSENFQESLTEETTETPVSYENSTTINNENIIPGEILIDINQNEEETLDELEKLEVLYNETGELKNVEQSLEVNTSAPEKGKKAIIAATAVIAALAALLIYASMNKTQNNIADNTSVLEKNLPKIDEQPADIENIVPKTPPKVEETAKHLQENVAKPKTPAIESPYIAIKKLGWSVPDYVSYNESFKKYLQTAGKSLKLSLSSDLLLATEYAYSNEVQVDITLSKEGSIKDAKILQSSGSTQIDDIVLRTVKDTLNVVKAPAGVIVGDNIHLTLKIYL